MMTIEATDLAYSPKTATAEVAISDQYAIGRSLFVVTAIDNDRDVPVSTDTPNAEFDYMVDPDYPNAARFFDVTKDGLVYVRDSLTEADGRSVFEFYIVSIDRSWQPLGDRTYVEVDITYTGLKVVFGFIQPIYRVSILENVEGDEAFGESYPIIQLGLANINSNRIVLCEIIYVNDVFRGTIGFLDYFGVRTTPALACEVYAKVPLDRDQIGGGVYNVTVRSQQPNRIKRQVQETAVTIANTWETAYVIITVMDANDNAPKFVYPLYPETILTEFYVGIVAIDAAANTETVQVQAFDRDEGEYGRITFFVEQEYGNDIPGFNISQDGTISTQNEVIKRRLDKEDKHYRLLVIAQDNAPQDIQKGTRTRAFINIVENKNIFVLELKNLDPVRAVANKELIRQMLQETTERIVLVHKIVGRRFLKEGNILDVDSKGTDVQFVILTDEKRLEINNELDILTSGAGSAPQEILENLRDLLDNVGDVESIHVPYNPSDVSGMSDVLGGTVVRLTKTYRWWLDDPWVALLIMAGIIILVCIVTLIILGMSWNRYSDYISHYTRFPQELRETSRLHQPTKLPQGI
ncbi:hypothetical protein ScPMuIL_004456 [Solemya velum]